MKAKVDENLCTGCGLCSDAAPEVFELSDEGVAKVIKNPADEHKAAVEEAAEGCPSSAITTE